MKSRELVGAHGAHCAPEPSVEAPPLEAVQEDLQAWGWMSVERAWPFGVFEWIMNHDIIIKRYKLVQI